MAPNYDLQISNLEKRVEQLLQLKVGPEGPAGPKGDSVRGPAGDISAAIRQAEIVVGDAERRIHETALSVVSESERRIQSQTDTVHAKLSADVKALRAEFAALKAYLDERITNAVDNGVVRVLEDYGVRDRNGDLIKY